MPKFTASNNAKQQSQDLLPGSVKFLVLYLAVFLGVFLSFHSSFQQELSTENNWVGRGEDDLYRISINIRLLCKKFGQSLVCSSMEATVVAISVRSFQRQRRAESLPLSVSVSGDTLVGLQLSAYLLLGFQLKKYYKCILL